MRRAILTGEDAAIEPLLVGGANPRSRLAIHRRHYEASLATALIEKFPATLWLTGSAFMTRAARQFVVACPPIRPCAAEYGDEFPAFLAALPGAAHLPYLRDFTELERRFAQAAIDIDLPPLSISDVAARGDVLSDAVVALQPGVRSWHASWPVDELLEAYLTDAAPERFEMERGSIYLEVRGSRGEVDVRRLSPGDFTFRTKVTAGTCLGHAVEHAGQLDPGFDPRRAFLTLVNEGLVTSIDLPAPARIP
jgi:hypothetical protein